MSSVHSRTVSVNPERQPFRPLVSPSALEWTVAEDGRASVFVRKGRKCDVYHVFPLRTDFGGCAFRWHKLDGSGTVHDLTLNGVESSCDCDGFCWTGGCRHLHLTRELVEAGVLTVAPDSAACGEEAA